MRIESPDALPDSIAGAATVERAGEVITIRLGIGTTAEQILTQLLDAEMRIERFEIALPSLEDIFIRGSAGTAGCRGRPMNKSLIVARHELTTMLSRTSFRVMTALVPVSILLMFIGIAVFVAVTGDDPDEAPETRTAGYVDTAGVITGYEQLGGTTFTPYVNEIDVRAAVAGG